MKSSMILFVIAVVFAYIYIFFNDILTIASAAVAVDISMQSQA